ncbi:MAG: ROK family protein [Paracoccaceae bacterium]|nr:ROK family protein [Paracoccaceae bacterium]
MICGGIDVGGTKIEARLFEGAEAAPGVAERWPTPQEGYAALLDQIASAAAWLQDTAADPALPVGLAIAGPIDPQSGESAAVNLVSSGQRIGADVASRLGRPVAVVNDCVAFTLSEANGGAGDAERSVVGLTLGTGLGAGQCIDKKEVPRRSGLPIEIGQMGVSAALAARHALPLWPCACGRNACFETYLSGAGLRALAAHILGRSVAPADLPDDPEATAVEGVFYDILAEALWGLYLTVAPDIIVLGGGLSNMPGFLSKARAAFANHGLGNLPLPALDLARFGDGSGARGAALVGRAHVDA